MTRLGILRSDGVRNNTVWNESSVAPLFHWLGLLWSTVKDHVQRRDQFSTQPTDENQDFSTQQTNENQDERKSLRRLRNNLVYECTKFYDKIDFPSTVIQLQACSRQLRKIPDHAAGCPEFGRVLADMVVILSPLTPHLAAEMWRALQVEATETNVFEHPWPVVDAGYKPNVSLVINVNYEKRLFGFEAEDCEMPDEEVLDLVFREHAKTLRKMTRGAPVLRRSVERGAEGGVAVHVFTLEGGALEEHRQRLETNKWKPKRSRKKKRESANE